MINWPFDCKALCKVGSFVLSEEVEGTQVKEGGILLLSTFYSLWYFKR